MSERLPDQASCASLAPAAAERYFEARPGSFEFKFGQAICGRCIAYNDCLMQSLADPEQSGLRAGYMATQRKQIRSRMLREHGTVDITLLTDDEELVIPRTLSLHNKAPESARVQPGRRYDFATRRSA